MQKKINRLAAVKTRVDQEKAPPTRARVPINAANRFMAHRKA